MLGTLRALALPDSGWFISLEWQLLLCGGKTKRVLFYSNSADVSVSLRFQHAASA